MYVMFCLRGALPLQMNIGLSWDRLISDRFARMRMGTL